MIPRIAMVKLIIGMAVALPESAYAQAGLERSQKPSIWQLSDICSIKVSIVNSGTNSANEILNQRCHGISVTQGSNLNIHFFSSHPSVGNPIFSFVLVEGPFVKDYPVELAVMLLGQKDETILDAEIGSCRLLPGEDKPRRAFVQCSSVTSTRPDRTYLQVTATALFANGLSPQIRSLLK